MRATGFTMAVFALSLAPPSATAAGPVGGQFEMFDVAVRGDRIIGHYLEEQGSGPVRRCAFAFTGTLRPDGRARIVARTTDGRTAPGRLTLRGDELALDLPGVNGFGGCSVPRGDWLSGSRTRRAPWTDLARVTAPRARFRPAPGGTPGARYVVRGDIVGVLRRTGAALLVEYAGGEGAPVRGWIAAGEAQSLDR